MLDPIKASEVGTKALAGDPLSGVTIGILVITGVVALGVRQLLLKQDLKNKIDECEKDLAVQIESINERISRAKESQKREFENVNKQCGVKYEIVAKQEARQEELNKQVEELRSRLNTHQTSTRFELEKIDTRITGIESLIKKEMFPAIKEGFNTVNKINTELALIKERLHGD